MTHNDPNKWIARWLAAGMMMLMVQILLGGITRLTGSGLSITEWDPIVGAIPPLNETAWKRSFELYHHIAQFKKVNSSFTLTDYKSIFIWEWLHREWARLMGLVFIVPFFILLFKRLIGRAMIRPLVMLFILGGLQGVVGWIMVKTGLNDTDVAVSHLALAVHFIFAMILLSYIFWFYLSVRVNLANRSPAPRATVRLNVILLALALFQLIYGAFMAGTHAALYAPGWPGINGSFIPSAGNISFINAVFYHPLFIQFIHRNVAYLITLLVFAWWISVTRIRRKTLLKRFKGLPLALIVLQVVLGISALLNTGQSAYNRLAISHQFTGILFFLSLVMMLFISKPKNPLRLI